MTILTSDKQTGLLTQEEASALIERAGHELTAEPSRGVSVDTWGNANAIKLHDEVVDPQHIRQSFLGIIVDHGPSDKGPPEDDFDDSRYWVKEVVEVTPPGTLATDPIGLAVFEVSGDEADNIVGRPAYHLVATNLAERKIQEPLPPRRRGEDPPELPPETHALAGEDCVIVRVFVMYDIDDVPRWYFFRTPAAAIGHVVIRAIPEATGPAGNRVIVSPLMHSNTDPWDNKYVIDDENSLEAITWPNVPASGYLPYAQTIEPGDPEEPVDPDGRAFLRPGPTPVPIMQIDGVWHIQQVPRHDYPVQDDRFAITGCLLKGEAP